MHVPAVRLMRQPIVENSFRHGYEGLCLTPTCTGIRGWGDGNAYVVEISDHGGGMDTHTMRNCNESFRVDIEEKLLLSENTMNKQGHIGLWNVHSRLRRLYGAAFGLEIMRSDPNGTVVSIRIPLHDKEKNT